MKSSPGDVLSTEVGPSTPPRVVVGVPPSDPPPSEGSDIPPSLEAEGVSRAPDIIGYTPTVPSVALENVEKPVTLPPVPPADVKQEFARTFVDTPVAADDDDKTKTFASFASTISFGTPASSTKDESEKKEKEEEKDEKTKTFASTIAFGSSVKIDEPVAEPAAKKKNLAQTLAFGSSLVQRAPLDEPPPDTKQSKQSAEPQPPARLDTTLKMDAAPTPVSTATPKKMADDKPLEAKKVETKPIEAKKVSGSSSSGSSDKKLSDSRGESKKKKGSSSGSDHHHDDVISERFFSEGDLSRHVRSPVADVTEIDALTVPDKAKRKSEPAVVQRRQRFVRYVTLAVGVAAVLCLAAVARTTLSKPTSASAKNAVSAAAPEPKAADPNAAPTASTTAAATDPSAAPGAADPSAAPAADPNAVASAAPSADPPKEEVTGDPKEEKAKMRAALERRKLDEAIEAGEKSVTLDPTDGEAWLILGASYQEKGKLADARRCYTACIKEGKTGPRHECAKMLR